MRGITQADLAERLGVDQSAIARIERLGRRIELAEFVAIARGLRIDPGKLFAQLYKSFHTKQRLRVRKRANKR